MMGRGRRLLAAGITLAGLSGAGLIGAAAAEAADGVVVHPGESIQAALDAAQEGDTITVSAGTYHEYLQISTDGVTLQGEGAVLEPPTDPAAPTNLCSDEESKD